MQLEIATERLILKPMTLEMVEEAIQNGCNAADGACASIEAAGFRTGGRWPGEDTYEILPRVKARLEIAGKPKGYTSWLIARESDGVIVGDAGFKNFPGDEDGEVEIGYGIMESERRKGYCYEAVSALIRWAFSHDEVKTVVAHCLIDNAASAAVLRKCGMKETGTGDGLIRWRLDKKP